MWSAILTFFNEHYPLVFLILVVAITVWFVAKFWFDLHHKVNIHDEKIKEQEAKTANLPCEEHTIKINDHNSLIERLDKRMEKVETLSQSIHDNVLSIQTFLQTKYKAAAPLFSQKFSPRRLNEKGMELYGQFGGKEFLDANGAMLMERISSKNPKTALDVEQYALEVLYETLDSDIYNSIKLKVYNSADIKIVNEGKEEMYSITMNDICFIFSLELRDRYLAAHPDVPQE